jgi:hypothetical protein
MYGIIHDCFECFVIAKFGRDFWLTTIVAIDVTAEGWILNKNYDDGVILKLAIAVCNAKAISTDELMYQFGYFFLNYVR